MLAQEVLIEKVRELCNPSENSVKAKVDEYLAL